MSRFEVKGLEKDNMRLSEIDSILYDIALILLVDKSLKLLVLNSFKILYDLHFYVI